MIWQALTAIGTIGLGLVAVFPIFREARRRKAEARSLRIRIGSQLMRLRLFYLAVTTGDYLAVGGGSFGVPFEGHLSAFNDMRDRLTEMMVETSVLDSVEQDLLGAIVMNFTAITSLLASGHYEGNTVLSEAAPKQLKLVDHLYSHFTENGMRGSSVAFPWQE